jgi:hypothetical protein
MEPPIQQFLKQTEENRATTGDQKQRRGDIAIVDIVQKKTIIIDVRTCAITSDAVRAGNAVAQGERDKHEFYNRTCDFPDGITMLPLSIDTYGRIGDEFKAFLSHYCKQAAQGNTTLYNMLITRSRNAIEVAHAEAIGTIINLGVNSCVFEGDRLGMGHRGTRSWQ